VSKAVIRSVLFPFHFYVAGACIWVQWILWRGNSTRWVTYISSQQQSWDGHTELTVSTSSVTIMTHMQQPTV